RFFEKAQLYSTGALIGGFRFKEQQLSQRFEKQYSEEVESMLKQKLSTFSSRLLLKIRCFKLLYFIHRIALKIGFDTYSSTNLLLKPFLGIPSFLLYDVKQKKFIKSNRPRLK
ncbi:MAG: hypothetical protein AAF599_20035, partial [Bacteroidota bacterium]